MALLAGASGLRELALFAGTGGGLLGTSLLGWHPVCAVEKAPYRREVLLRRQRDGVLPLFPIWDDVRTFDGRSCRGKVDIITAGDPCQENSNARQGYDAREPSLGDEVVRIVDEVRPRLVLRENPSAVRADAPWPWYRMRQELERLGYVVLPFRLRACCLGFDHRRDRLFVLAELPDADKTGFQGNVVEEMACARRRLYKSMRCDRRHAASRICRGTDGVAHRMDRIAAIGDGQVPAVVAAAWRLLIMKSN